MTSKRDFLEFCQTENIEELLKILQPPSAFLSTLSETDDPEFTKSINLFSQHAIQKNKLELLFILLQVQASEDLFIYAMTIGKEELLIPFVTLKNNYKHRQMFSTSAVIHAMKHNKFQVVEKVVSKWKEEEDGHHLVLDHWFPPVNESSVVTVAYSLKQYETLAFLLENGVAVTAKLLERVTKSNNLFVFRIMYRNAQKSLIPMLNVRWTKHAMKNKSPLLEVVIDAIPAWIQVEAFVRTSGFECLQEKLKQRVLDSMKKMDPKRMCKLINKSKTLLDKKQVFTAYMDHSYPTLEDLKQHPEASQAILFARSEIPREIIEQRGNLVPLAQEFPKWTYELISRSKPPTRTAYLLIDNVDNIVTPEGANILHVACSYHRHERIRGILATQPALAASVDKNGNTPLMMLMAPSIYCYSSLGTEELLQSMKLLIHHGCNINAVNQSGMTALLMHVSGYYYMTNSKILAFMESHGAHFFAKAHNRIEKTKIATNVLEATTTITNRVPVLEYYIKRRWVTIDVLEMISFGQVYLYFKAGEAAAKFFAFEDNATRLRYFLGLVDKFKNCANMYMMPLEAVKLLVRPGAAQAVPIAKEYEIPMKEFVLDLDVYSWLYDMEVGTVNNLELWQQLKVSPFKQKLFENGKNYHDVLVIFS